jgi:hypothetical protein
MTYTCPAWEFAAGTYLLKLQRLKKTKFSAQLEIFLDLHSAFTLPYLYDHITKRCSAGNKQTSYKIMRMNMFAAQRREKPDIQNIRGLNLAEVKLKTVQVTKLPL